MNPASFPIRTKIASFLMMGVGSVLFGFGLIGIVQGMIRQGDFAGYPIVIGFVVSIGGLLVVIPGIFILKKKRLGWWVSICILDLELIALAAFTPTYPPIIKELYHLSQYLNSFLIITLLLFSFLLLLLDRKNFWKISL